MTRSTILILIARILVPTVILCIAIAAAPLAAQDLGECRNLIRHREYDRARRALRAALDDLEGSERHEALLMLARIETRLEEAEPLYREVIETGSPQAELRARIELAKLSYAAGDYRAAADTLLAIPPESAPADIDEAIYIRGLSWKQLGENARARSDLAKVANRAYQFWASTALAGIEMEEGRYAEAILRLRSAGSDRSNPVALFKLGECYEATGETDAALRAYRDLINRFPHSLEAARSREKAQRIEGGEQGGRAQPARAGGGEEGKPAVSERSRETPRQRGFTLQFGAFGSRENAEVLAARLRKLVPDARIEEATTGGRTVYRVRAGRFTDREEAERAGVRLTERLGYPCKVLSLE